MFTEDVKQQYNNNNNLNTSFISWCQTMANSWLIPRFWSTNSCCLKFQSEVSSVSIYFAAEYSSFLTIYKLWNSLRPWLVKFTKSFGCSYLKLDIKIKITVVYFLTEFYVQLQRSEWASQRHVSWVRISQTWDLSSQIGLWQVTLFLSGNTNFKLGISQMQHSGWEI